MQDETTAAGTSVEPAVTPIKSFAKAAQVLGMSEDALLRKRRRCNDRTRVAWWRDTEAVVRWFEAMIAPPPIEASKVRRRTDTDRGPIDPRAVARELAGSK
jgi:hypothetical protein